VRLLKAFLIFIVLLNPLHGEDFKVGDVIHPIVAKLPTPRMVEGFDQGFMVVSTSSDVAAKHVSQGMACLNTSWDFEAYRHFCEAAKLDVDCLMAYWGITMSLAGSQHEYFEQRQKSMERMLNLMEWEKKEGKGKWTQLELGYAQAAGLLLTSGPAAAAEVFQMIARKFPNDVQSNLFYQFLKRDGFDSFGKPKIGQRKSGEELFKILKVNPEVLSVMSFWVTSQTEGAFSSPELRKDVLPVARKLVRLNPDYAPFHLMLTHAEAHAGNAALAIVSAKEAVTLYEHYMKSNEVSVFDCEGWVRAKLYLANLYETKGEHAKALEVARELAQVKITKERVFSRGAGLLLWEGRTAGARLMMGQADKASFYEGQKILELLPEEQWHKEESFALYYRDCLAFYLGIRVAISVKDKKNANGLFGELIKRVRSLESRKEVAAKTSTYANWLRATNTLGIAVAELKGMLAELETGATKSSAVNWYRAAAGRQNRPANLMPPKIDYPIQLRIGDFYFKGGEMEKAGKAYREGLDVRPNHLATLKGYQKALLKLGRAESAEVLRKRIEAVEK